MKSLKIKNLLLPVLFFISYSLVAQQLPIIDIQKAGFSEERLARLSDYLNQEIEEGELVGAVSLIVRNEATAHFQSYGASHLSDQSPMQKDQLFFIQSMTKPIISVAFMMLFEEGHFDLNDPLEDYLPAFADMQVQTSENEADSLDEPIRIWHLLSHTAGLSHGLGGSALDKKYREALYMQQHQNIEARVDVLPALPLVGQPGEQWYYSAAPDVLSLLIEQFSGMSTAEFLQTRIFDPLGMEDTGYNVAEDQKERVVGLHFKNQDGELTVSERQTPTSGNTVYGGTHGLFSTARDYMRFCRMLLNKGALDGQRLLSPKTVELMTVNHVNDLYGEGYGFGLGFSVRTDLADPRALGSVGTFGWSGAFNTYFFIDPKEELAGILMTQFAPYTNFYNNKFQQLVYQAIIE
ncbi:CubicO group peptidase (beta-lactamase class C family) [Catalinimonas alkaloidigena]|uniref:serine hydrolase domain-containing protein n=1 Tax=Catalinimonas alkaloidigena TaxID=1075417 RepID=UPI00240722BA|nr:serine hydrolase [Catalinimonas alkaloidigena]MDF9798563.1 CubicO group peptidase (beta-lactamase class C family) [Catalinimonas alkaloidigena]